MKVCILCKSSKDNELKYGEFLTKGRIWVHTFCLYLSSNLAQRGEDHQGILGFLLCDIEAEEHRVSHLNCCYCSKPNANIGCCESKCRRSFHLTCGVENGAQNQFISTYNSYCNNHIRKIKYFPTKEDECCICYENIWFNVDNENDDLDSKLLNKNVDFRNVKFNPISMLRAPCCHNGWFHKICLQKFAKTAGYFFKCPLCNDSNNFRNKLSFKGIFIPNIDAAWELEPNAFEELLQRPNICSAKNCGNRRGRNNSSTINPFIVCTICGSTAFHRFCTTQASNNFKCDDCEQILKTTRLEDKVSSKEESEANDNTEDIEVDVCNLDEETSAHTTNTKNMSAVHGCDGDTDDTDYFNSAKFCSLNRSRAHRKRVFSSDSNSSNEFITSTRKRIRKNNFASSCEDSDSQTSISKMHTKSKEEINNNGKEKHCLDVDPLENENLYFEKKEEKTGSHSITKVNADSVSEASTEIESVSHNVSCIARRTRHKSNSSNKSSSIEKEEETKTPPIHRPANDNSSDHINLSLTSKRKRGRPRRNTPKLFHSENSSDSSDVSDTHKCSTVNGTCIANRTRRRIKEQLKDRPTHLYSENTTDSSDMGTDTSDTQKCSTLNASSIVNRTRRRKNISIQERSEHIRTHCYPENTTDSSDMGTDISDIRTLKASCIANRTRRRKSVYIHERLEDTIVRNINFYPENTRDSSDMSSEASDTQKCSTMNASSIVNRTRRRKNISIQERSEHIRTHCYPENIIESSDMGSETSDTQKSSTLNASSIVNRTRRRKSVYIQERLEHTIGRDTHFNPENTTDSSDKGSEPSDTQKCTSFNASCIANRTRRKSIYIPEKLEHIPEDNERQQSYSSSLSAASFHTAKPSNDARSSSSSTTDTECNNRNYNIHKPLTYKRLKQLRSKSNHYNGNESFSRSYNFLVR